MGKFLPRCALASMVAIAVPLVAAMSGCTGADQPKLADAPPVAPGKPVDPPKIPGQKKAFTQVPGYSKYMSNGGQPPQ